VAGWHSLSTEESQVAQPVAAGRSNPEIAAELTLSRRIVQVHASRITAGMVGRSTSSTSPDVRGP
jgi:DNA-binding NarL/FixJ family response regulator